MSVRTIGVMGRLLEQAHGLEIHAGHLLRHMVSLFNPKFSLPLFCRIPGVLILQSSDWYVNPRNYPWWDNIYIRAMLPLYCRRARATLAISQATLADLARHGLRLPHPTVIHVGVGPRFTPDADPQDLRQLRSEYAHETFEAVLSAGPHRHAVRRRNVRGGLTARV